MGRLTISAPDITKIGAGWLSPRYRLNAPCEVDFMLFGNRIRFIIPAGFTYDGANYGWAVFWNKSADGAPALIHDWLYTRRGLVHGYTDCGAQLFTFDRKAADRMFRYACEGININKWRYTIAYAALRLFGWIWWGMNKKESKHNVEVPNI